MKRNRIALAFCAAVLSVATLITAARAKDSYADFDKPYSQHSQRPPRATTPQSSPIKSVTTHKVSATAEPQSPKAGRTGHYTSTSDAFMPAAHISDPNYTPATRAKYWKTKGYDFDPNKMTAFAMDDRGADLDRAKYWKAKGHAFDANQMSALDMDQRVADLERAKYWKERGFNFDANAMSDSSILHASPSASTRKSP